MMKKLLICLTLIILTPLSACAAEKTWEEGVHYKVLNMPVSAAPEVKEFFSFWCSHCFRTEPFVKMLKTKLEGKASFKKVHVNYMPNTTPEIQDYATKALMIAIALKQEESLSAAIFNYLHKQRAQISSLQDIRNIFVINGVDGKKFDMAAKSVVVDKKIKENTKVRDAYKNHVNGVPSFVVNGKYKVTFVRGMTVDDQVDLILWLLDQK